MREEERRMKMCVAYVAFGRGLKIIYAALYSIRPMGLWRIFVRIQKTGCEYENLYHYAY